MQTIKTLFKSPRFVVGFLMVLIIVCYAIFVPIIFTADPKETRAENPYYTEVATLIDALNAEDDALIQEEMDRLLALAAANEDDILTDAANNVVDVVTAAQKALAANPYDNAISALDQCKSARKFSLVNTEFADMKSALEKGDQAAAEEEGSSLTAHCEAAAALGKQLTAAGSKWTSLQEILDGAVDFTETELADLAAAVEAKDADALAEAIEAFTAQHATLATQVQIAIERIEDSLYVKAADAAATAVQQTYLIPQNHAPTSTFWFGTDNFSRDVFLEMAHGARTSLLVGIIAGCLATAIGIVLGLVAGFMGGLVDNVIVTIANTFTVIPTTVILILISIAMGTMRDPRVTGFIIGLVSWPWTTRSVRSQTISLRNRDHVNMARITGYSTAHIILTEIMPYLASYIVMAFILQVAGGIGQEATLAMLGLGDPTGISLGRMMNWAMQYEAINFGRWWLFIPVACAIAMITFGLYLMNSGMDQIFNPKIRS